MVLSESWTKKRIESSLIGWCIVSFFVLSGNTPSAGRVFAQDAKPNVFLVHSSVPYQITNTESPKSETPKSESFYRQSLSRDEIGQLASRRSAASRLVSADVRSRTYSSRANGKDDENLILVPFQCAIAHRLRQSSAANALKLHYGIAACLQAERLLDETRSLLDVQRETQSQLIDRGIPIPDPLLVERLNTTMEDKRIDNQSKLHVLRTQLVALIGAENACSHAPTEIDSVIPSDCDVCDRIKEALECRCDLVTLQRLRGSISAETLDLWDRIGALTSGVPTRTKTTLFWTKFLRTRCNQTENQNAVAARRAWLEELITERTKQIVMEVEIAFEKKKSAALRWVKVGTQLEHWNSRISQLEKLGESHGNLAEQMEAKLSRQQERGLQIERWLEWHQASVDLALAIGCEK
jgi:hypothetical protein